jgi:hypothetical protein
MLDHIGRYHHLEELCSEDGSNRILPDVSTHLQYYMLHKLRDQSEFFVICFSTVAVMLTFF